VPSIDSRFSRVNVLLGANGSGKTRTLKWLLNGPPHGKAKNRIFPKGGEQSPFWPGRPAIRIEGGRTMALAGSLAIDLQEFRQLQTEESRDRHYALMRTQFRLSDRVKFALLLIERLGEEAEKTWAKRVALWSESSRSTPLPPTPEAPLARLLRMFS